MPTSKDYFRTWSLRYNWRRRPLRLDTEIESQTTVSEVHESGRPLGAVVCILMWESSVEVRSDTLTSNSHLCVSSHGHINNKRPIDTHICSGLPLLVHRRVSDGEPGTIRS